MPYLFLQQLLQWYSWKNNNKVVMYHATKAIEKLEKDSNILYDLFDLEKIFKVTKRTLFNWRAKGDLPLIEFGGKLYLSKGQLRELIIQKGGVL